MRALTLAGAMLGGVGLLVALLAWLRAALSGSMRQPPARTAGLSAAILPAGPPDALSSPAAPPRPDTQRASWLAFLAVLIGSAVAFVLLPRAVAVVLFWGLVIGVLLVAAVARLAARSEAARAAAGTASSLPRETVAAPALTGRARALRGTVFVIVLLAATILFVLLPRQWSIALFWTLAVALLVAGGVMRLGGLQQRVEESVPPALARVRDRLAGGLARAWALFDAQREWLSPLVAIGAVALMIASAHGFRQENFAQYPELNTAALLMLLGGVALGVGLLLQRQREALPGVEAVTLVALRVRWRMVATGVVMLALLTEANADLLHLEPLQAMTYPIQFALFGAGVILVGWGLSGREPPAWARREFWTHALDTGNALPEAPSAAPPDEAGQSGTRAAAPGDANIGDVNIGEKGRAWRERLSLHVPGLARWETWVLLLIVALALFLRFWQLETLIHKFVDEIHHMHAITVLWDEPQTRILTPFSDVAAFPWLFPYLQTVAVTIFGPSLLGVRAVSAVMGALTTLAVYGLGRVWFDRKTALLAALLLAVFPPHLHFSRIGINNIADPLVGTLALACLGWGLRWNRQPGYGLGGAFLGLTQYFYEGGRLFYVPFTLLWLLGMAVLWRLSHGLNAARSGQVRARTRGLLLAALACALVAAPLYITLIGQELPLFPRMNAVGVPDDHLQAVFNNNDTLKAQVDRLGAAFLFLVHLPDQGWFYSGDTALLLPALIPPFLLGVFWTLWRWRRPGMFLLLTWVLATAFGNGLLLSPRESPRFLVAFPAMALLMAVGLRYTLPLAWPGGQSTALQRRWVNALLVVVALALAVVQINYYFGTHVEVFNERVTQGREGLDAIFRALDLPPHTVVHVYSNVTFWDINLSTMLRFWDRQDDLEIETVYVEELTEETLLDLRPGAPHAFFLEPGDTATLALLRRYFELGPPQFSPYNIPAQQQLVMYYTAYLPNGMETLHGRRRW